jgi:IS5 family transposase
LRPSSLSGSEEEAYGDGAYAGKPIAKILEERNIKNNINRRAYRNKPLTEDDEEYNSTMSSVCYVVERTFGAIKRHYGADKTRFLGIQKTQGWLTVIAI